MLPPEITAAISRYEKSIGRAWVLDCREGTSTKKLEEVWAMTEQRHAELIAAIEAAIPQGSTLDKGTDNVRLD